MGTARCNDCELGPCMISNKKISNVIDLFECDKRKPSWKIIVKDMVK